MDKTDRLRDYGLAFLLYEQGLGICGYELIRELFIFVKLILNSYLMKVTINNQEIILKNSFRALIAYEQITEKAFNPVTMTDMIIYFYSVVISSANLETPISLEDFISYLDENQGLLEEFSKWVIASQNANNVFQKEEKKTSKRKVKK